MTCPECNAKTKVIDSREDVDSKKRMRKCMKCGYRFSTIEIDNDLYERMVKKNDIRQRKP